MTEQWGEYIGEKTSQDWCLEISKYTTSGFKDLLNQEKPPTVAQLNSLPWTNTKQGGVYGHIIRPLIDGHNYHLYVGSASSSKGDVAARSQYQKDYTQRRRVQLTQEERNAIKEATRATENAKLEGKMTKHGKEMAKLDNVTHKERQDKRNKDRLERNKKAKEEGRMTSYEKHTANMDEETRERKRLERNAKKREKDRLKREAKKGAAAAVKRGALSEMTSNIL